MAQAQPRYRSWRYKVTGLTPMMNALTKVAAPLETGTAEPLNKVAMAAFMETTNDVHVITGKLRLSGRLETVTLAHTWQMKIKYAAYRKDVNYAYYEMVREGSKSRGFPPFGPHNFFAGLDELVNSGVEKAIDKHFAPMK